MSEPLGPPPGWDTPGRTVESYAPVNGPVVDSGGGDVESIDVTPPGVPDDAGNDDTIAGTVTDAIALAMARMTETASDTLEQGSTIGDEMPLPPAPDRDTTVLTAGPGAY